MNDREFAAALRQEVVEANLLLYRQLFEETSSAEATDPYWKDSLVFYAQLDENQRAAVFEVIRQVIVDTTSNLLAILDGTSRLRAQREDLSLLHGAERIDGDLQDYFLELEGRQ